MPGMQHMNWPQSSSHAVHEVQPVVQVTVILGRDGSPRGYGFVQLATRAQAERVSAAATAEADGAIVGRDIEEAQLEAARANASRAGVGALLHFERADAGSLLDGPMEPVGHLIANPPWGRRVGGGAGAAPIPRLLQQLADHTPKQWGWTVILPAQGRPRFGRLGTGPVATVRSGGVRARVEVRTAGSGPVMASETSADPTAS